MDKYVRKVVHLELSNKSLCQLEKKLVAYYKMEKRNGRIKVTLSVEGVKFLNHEPLYFCLVVKEAEDYRIKKIKPIIINVNRIEEIFYIDNINIEDIRGCLILDIYDKPYNKENIMLSGFQGEPLDFDLLKIEELNQKQIVEASNEPNKLATKLNESDSKRYKTSYKEEVVEKEDRYKTELKSTKNNLNEFIDSNGVGKTETEEMSKLSNENQQINKDLIEESNNNQSISQKFNYNDKNMFNDEADVKNKSYKYRYETLGNDKEKTEDHTNGDTNKNESNENTIEYIKKQLELKEEIGVIDDLFNKNQRLIPFDFKEDQTDWVKIEITDLVFLPLESWMLINNAFLMTCYRKYKHLILGRDEKEKVLKLGIPDIYYFKESLVANVCGFHEFYPCSGCPPKAGEYGYWIIKTNL